MAREPYVTVEHETGIPPALSWVSDMVRRGLAAGPVVVRLGRPKRSDPQNRRLWASLGDVSAQVEWWGRKLSPEEWKHVFSAGMKKQDVVPNIEGSGFVVLGLSTSKMSKQEFADLLDLIQHFGDSKGVKWSEP